VCGLGFHPLEESLIGQPSEGRHHGRVGDLTILVESPVDIAHGDLTLIPHDFHDVGLEWAKHLGQRMLTAGSRH
jgi:hypothetical protein